MAEPLGGEALQQAFIPNDRKSASFPIPHPCSFPSRLMRQAQSLPICPPASQSKGSRAAGRITLFYVIRGGGGGVGEGIRTPETTHAGQMDEMQPKLRRQDCCLLSPSLCACDAHKGGGMVCQANASRGLSDACVSVEHACTRVCPRQYVVWVA